jgi:hypothetical protein
MEPATNSCGRDLTPVYNPSDFINPFKFIFSREMPRVNIAINRNEIFENKYFLKILSVGILTSLQTFEKIDPNSNIKIITQCIANSKIWSTCKTVDYINKAKNLIENINDKFKKAESCLLLSDALKTFDLYEIDSDKYLKKCYSTIKKAKNKKIYNDLIYRMVKLYLFKGDPKALSAISFLHPADPLKTKALCKVATAFPSSDISKKCFLEIQEIFQKNVWICEHLTPRVIGILNCVELSFPKEVHSELKRNMTRIQNKNDPNVNLRLYDPILDKHTLDSEKFDLQNFTQNILSSCNSYNIYNSNNQFVEANSEMVRITTKLNELDIVDAPVVKIVEKHKAYSKCIGFIYNSIIVGQNLIKSQQALSLKYFASAFDLIKLNYLNEKLVRSVALELTTKLLKNRVKLMLSTISNSKSLSDIYAICREFIEQQELYDIAAENLHKFNTSIYNQEKQESKEITEIYNFALELVSQTTDPLTKIVKFSELYVTKNCW